MSNGKGRGAPEEKLAPAVADARKFQEAWLEQQTGKITELLPPHGSPLIADLVRQSVYVAPDLVQPLNGKNKK